MKAALLTAGALGAIFLLARGRKVAAKDLSFDEALAALPTTRVLRSTPSAAGTVLVQTTLGGVKFSYLGKPSTKAEMDPRMAVLLERLGRFLRGYGVVQVDHMGIYPGISENPSDVHNLGRAIDLSQFIFANGEKLSVYKDWGSKPGANGEYRLKPSDRGYRFFADLYSFLSSEAESGGALGERSYLLTPDTPNPDLRETHQDHIHVQVSSDKHPI